MAPRAPSFYGSKPSKPFCAAARNCTTFDVENYRNQLRRFYSDLQQYLVEAYKFYKLAYEYADCEAGSD